MTYTLERTCDAAPVQYEGKIGDLYFYFRARWNGWSFGIGKTQLEAAEATMYENGLFSRRSDWGGEFAAASWMPFDVAEELIRQCIEEYYAS